MKLGSKHDHFSAWRRQRGGAGRPRIGAPGHGRAFWIIGPCSVLCRSDCVGPRREPVVDGIAQSDVGGLAHQNDVALVGSQRDQRRIVRPAPSQYCCARARRGPVSRCGLTCADSCTTFASLAQNPQPDPGDSHYARPEAMVRCEVNGLR